MNKINFEGHIYKNNSQKILILLHGFGGTSKEGLIKDLATEIKEVDVLTFDFYDYPFNLNKKSVEETTLSYQLNSLKKAFNYLTNLGYKEIYLAGHSLGGYTAHLFAQNNSLKKLIMLAPPYDLAFNRLTSNIDLKKWKEQGYWMFNKMKINYTFVEDAQQYSLKPITIPTLLFHCQDDFTVPYEQALKYQKLTPLRLITFKEGGHFFNNKIKEIKKELISFLNS
jgi:esterase/lipase